MNCTSQSRRRRAIFVVGLVLVLTLCAYVGWVRLSGPRYQGKRVSVWFRQYCNLRLTNAELKSGRGECAGRRMCANHPLRPPFRLLVIRLMTPAVRQRQRHAFTLIELLV